MPAATQETGGQQHEHEQQQQPCSRALVNHDESTVCQLYQALYRISISSCTHCDSMRCVAGDQHCSAQVQTQHAVPLCRCRIYTRWDALALLYAVFLNFTLLRMFRPNWLNPAMWHFTLQFSLYFATAAAQLLLLWLRPQHHQQHRMRIIAAHRLFRLACMGLSAVASDAQHASAVQGTLTSTSGGSFLVTGYTWLKLLRSVLAFPLVAMAPSNFVLPVRCAILCQLCTLAFTLRMTRMQHCLTASIPELQGLLQQACSALGGAAHWVSLLLWRGSATSGLAAGDVGMQSDYELQVCSSSAGSSLVLSMYASVLLVLLVPCFLQYSIERRLKESFLKSKQLTSAWLQQELAAAAAAVVPSPVSAGDAGVETEFDIESKQPWVKLLCDVLLVAAAYLASWHLCLAAVAHMPYACN
jgi:hypothetical protein